MKNSTQTLILKKSKKRNLNKSQISKPYNKSNELSQDKLRGINFRSNRKTGIKKELQHRIEFEKLITNISNNFINVTSDKIDNAINNGLQIIGKFANADRSYILLIREGGEYADNTHEWCAQGISRAIEKLKIIPIKNYSWLASKILKSEIVYIPSLKNLPKEAYPEKELLSSLSVKSIICVPMIYGGKVLGMLGFDSVRAEKTWADENIMLLKLAGEIFANAIERKNNEQKLNLERKQLLSIFESIDDPVYVSDPDTYEVLYINNVIKNTFGQVEGEKCYKAFQGLKSPCSFCTNKQIFEDNAGQPHIWESQNMINKHWYHCIDKAITWPNGKKVRCEIAIDITDHKLSKEKLEKLNNDLLKSNKKLNQMTLKDPLTDLYNHRYLEEVIEAELHRTRRFGHSLSVIAMDIDYFKSINDVYGFKFGDTVIKQFANQLKKIVRKYDIVVRFGGEEFIIISPGTDRNQCTVFAKRILNSINIYNFGDEKHSIKLKLSAAIASYPEDKIVNGMDLVNFAYKVLDKAKEEGGNRVYSSLDINNGNHVEEKNTNVKSLKEKMEKMTKQSNQNLIESIFAFAKTIELKDQYTGRHVEMTVQYATEIASALNLHKDEVEHIRQASILHDLGKIGISEKILLKKSKLTEKEFDSIKKHPQIGVDIIRPIQFLHSIIPLIFYHHERWDGKGYPSGLKGEDVPIGARVIAIADVYQALTSDRPYRKAYSKEKALQIIKKGSGSQFDPQIVDVFTNILKREK